MMELARVIVRDHQLVYSTIQLLELKDVLDRPKFRNRFLPGQKEELFHSLAQNGVLVELISEVDVCRDPDDNHLLALCKDGKVDRLITGDKDLLVLKKFGKTRILAPADFIKQYK
ncbi:MAG: putative toxin-antitoxin system toxin component, PIN family [Flavobacteriales bacterium]